jgi:methyl-accepting chemotaxis protein
MKFSIRAKLLASFAVLLILMVFVSINTWLQMQNTAQTQQRIIEVSQPSVLHGQTFITGINRSLAGLRGYIILGGDPQKAEIFNKERLKGWQEIDDSMIALADLSANWSNIDDINALTELKLLLETFRAAQQEIENISQQPQNIPSIDMLTSSAAPAASEILKAITQIIDEESALAATEPRKILFKALADSRGSFAVGLANIRAYLLTGDNKFATLFEKAWQTNTDRYENILTMTDLFSHSQKKSWDAYKTLRKTFAPMPKKMFVLRANPDWNLANYWLGTKAAPTANKISKLLHNIHNSQVAFAKQDTHNLLEITATMTLVLIIGTISALIIGLLIALVISHKITQPIHLAVQRTEEIANGDLTGEPLVNNSKDELTILTTALNEMTKKLRSTMGQFGVAGKELTSAADNLGKSSAITSSSMENQQLETQKAAAAMFQINETVEEVARNTLQASESAEEASDVSLRGTSAVQETVESISSLALNLDTAKEAINKLGTDTEGVDDIVSVIRSIADQTNLLALNAAIEAARAGEQGRGFAVVADEVRTLAARTQQSTQEIQTVLQCLKEGVIEVVNMMSNSHDLAQNCLGKANNTSNFLSDINEAVTNILQRNNHIASASEEQNAAIKEVNQNIVNINNDAETILKRSRDTSLAANKAGDLTADMDQMISQFQVQ